MRKMIKIFTIFSIIGLLIAMSGVVSGFDINELKDFFSDDSSYTLENYILNTEIENIELDLNDRNIKVSLIDGDELVIRYYKKDLDSFDFSHQNGKLTLIHDQSYQFSLFNFKVTSSYIKTLEIEIPHDWNINLDLQTKTGNIDIYIQTETYHFYNSSFETNTGNIYLKNVSFDHLDLITNTGNQTLIDSIVNEDLSLKTDTGNVVLRNVSSDTIDIDVQTGNTKLTDVNTQNANLSTSTGRTTISDSDFKNLIINSITGSLNITETNFEDLNISTSTGDVTLYLDDITDYQLDLKVITGRILINDVNQGNTHNQLNGLYKIRVRVTTGNITIGF
jgi:DUF4097 and DUF4098 domain-containing protein YvlB